MRNEPGFLWLKASINTPIEDLRNVFTWGTYGKDGHISNYKRVLLKDMSNDHIKNIINDYYNGANYQDEMISVVFKSELMYRDKHNIDINDIYE